MIVPDLGILERALGYSFGDRALLEQALTHRSSGQKNNERLEFLGDSIVNLFIAESLSHQFPECNEGELTLARSELVCGKTLAGLARSIELKHHLRLGSGELKSGGSDRDSILADAFEAILGAIYLDGGSEAVFGCAHRLYQQLLAGIDPANQQRDPKSQLQEVLQSRGEPLPEYRVITITGEPHRQHFIVECYLRGIDSSVRGEGGSRRDAEKRAASRLLAQLGVTDG